MSPKTFYKPSLVVNVLFPVGFAIVVLWAYQKKIKNPDELGMAKQTTTYLPCKNGLPIHINHIDYADSLWIPYKHGSKTHINLWLGNSQLHGINQYRMGEKNSVEFCYDSLAQQNEHVLGISYPNANLQELLLTVLYTTSSFPVKSIVVPVFYDDMREDGIRARLKDFLTDFVSNFKSRQYIKDIPSILAMDNTKIKVQENIDMKALQQTAQEKSEIYFDRQLRNAWTIWDKRYTIRSNLFYDLYNIKNDVFRIKSNTERKMIPGRYQVNFLSLINILKYCKERSIVVNIYIPPLRDDVAPPYDIAAYHKFIKDVELEVNKYDAKFFNFGGIVPPAFWGSTLSGFTNKSQDIDFMHFQEGGHKILADTIYQILKRQN